MKIANTKIAKRTRRHKRIRAKLSGTEERPRLAIYKSNTAIYAQVIDDVARRTLASAKGTDAEKVGTEVAKAAIAKSVKTVVFDRGGYIFTGKVKVLAESARKAGLTF